MASKAILLTTLLCSVECRECPGGYECKLDATNIPVFCGPGMYRPADASVACDLCPQGTWSQEFSNIAPELCEPCPVRFKVNSFPFICFHLIFLLLMCRVD